MDARDLIESVNYTGMERDLRKLAAKLEGAEQVACMSLLEICGVVLKVYDILLYNSETIMLVKKEDMEVVNGLIEIVSRWEG